VFANATTVVLSLLLMDVNLCHAHGKGKFFAVCFAPNARQNPNRRRLQCGRRESLFFAVFGL
jgi:hypothetical protein